MVMATYGLIVGSFQTHQICMVFGFVLSAVSIVIVFVYVSSKDEEEGTIWTEVRKQTTRIKRLFNTTIRMVMKALEKNRLLGFS